MLQVSRYNGAQYREVRLRCERKKNESLRATGTVYDPKHYDLAQLCQCCTMLKVPLLPEAWYTKSFPKAQP